MSRAFLPLLPIALFLSSCARTIEDHLIGEWKLDVSYRKEFFGRDYFQTGYEDGVFTFIESGRAIYINGPGYPGRLLAIGFLYAMAGLCGR
jgi:hypothetical protein